LENKELFRVPIYKGNTKYGAGYDRLVNFDGSTTDVTFNFLEIFINS